DALNGVTRALHLVGERLRVRDEEATDPVVADHDRAGGRFPEGRAPLFESVAMRLERDREQSPRREGAAQNSILMPSPLRRQKVKYGVRIHASETARADASREREEVRLDDFEANSGAPAQVLFCLRHGERAVLDRGRFEALEGKA